MITKKYLKKRYNNTKIALKILKKIATSLKDNLPFVAYKKPNKNTVTAFFQENDELFFTENFLESGFVFAPFDDTKPSVLIPENQSDFIEEVLGVKVDEFESSYFPSNENSKGFHTAIVEKAIKSIVNNEFKKVVLSRKETICITTTTIPEIFKRLLLTYTNAMVYVWYHPKVGLWLGATPEMLLKVKGDVFETMSLAGTQVFNNKAKVIWQPKEIDEQNIVTNYITNRLQDVCNSILVEETTTVKAGNLLHLKTRITGTVISNKNRQMLKELIRALHPTPAICGFPKKEAKKFIIDNENYDRTFYTGFLGELNLKNTTNLFVNLRCMQIQNKNAIIYVGGGITKDSNPIKEWEETALKTEVIKRVLG